MAGELTIPAEATCWGCGYNLQHLPRLRCPECGQPFDPLNPMSVRTPESRRRARGIEVAALVVFTLTAAFLSMLALQYCPWMRRLAAILLGSAVAMIAWWRLRRLASEGRPGSLRLTERRRYRRLRGLLFAAAAVLAFPTWSCHHSWGIEIGHYQLVWGDPGCRDPRIADLPRHAITARLAWYDQREWQW